MKLLLPGRLRDELEARVQAAAPGSALVWFDEQGRCDGNLSDAEVFLRWFTPPPVFNGLLAQMPALRWLHLPRAGVDGSLVPAVIEREIVLTNSAGINAVPIAEFVLLFALSHAKQAAALLAAQSTRTWAQHELKPAELYGRTMLIIGLGQIGQAIATRAAAFGMRVIGSRRRPTPTAGVDMVVGEGEWRPLLGEADYVVLAAPLTAATRGMIGAAELAAMRPDAYLINIARGEIVDEAALVEALRAGKLAGAGLDVFAQEPLPQASPLWELPNVFLTPHISWSSPEIWPRVIELFLDNLRRYVAGEPLRNVVDKAAGY
jgi:phosphoglycerate dehydrogenase-like enzyme